MTWLFHSPRRFAAVTALLLSVALGVPLALALGRGPEPATRRPVGPSLMDPDAAKRAAVDFVAHWCELGDRTAEQWATDLRARSVPGLAGTWSTVETANLTGDCPYGLTYARWIDSQGALFAVSTKAGRPVLVRVVQSGDRVLVASIGDDDQGDV